MSLSALETAVTALEKSLDSIETWLAISTFLVVIGLVLEYWHEVKELIEQVRKRPPFPWKKLQEIVGGVLVTVGVAGELALQFHASTVETAIRSNSHKIEAILNDKASEANKEAGFAGKDAAAANLTAKGFESQIAASDARIAEANKIGVNPTFLLPGAKYTLYEGAVRKLLRSLQQLFWLIARAFPLKPL